MLIIRVQLMCEGLYLYGTLLLNMDRKISGRLASQAGSRGAKPVLHCHAVMPITPFIHLLLNCGRLCARTACSGLHPVQGRVRTREHQGRTCASQLLQNAPSQCDRAQSHFITGDQVDSEHWLCPRAATVGL